MGQASAGAQGERRMSTAIDERMGKRGGRRRDLEMMGALVVVGLIFFHSARIFDSGEFYVKNESTSVVVDVALAFAITWAMPLMFLMAGMAVWYSLRKRNAGQFLLERTKRLLVPLIFGVLVLIPPQVYIGLHQDPDYDESYWDFLPQFFDVTLDFREFPFIVHADPETGLYEPGQLWFLVCLYAFTLVLLPLFVYLRRPAAAGLIQRGADLLAGPWTVFLLALPLAFIQMTLGGEVRLAAWNRWAYLLFILYGFLIAADGRFGRSFQRRWRPAIIGGSLTFIGYLTLYIYLTEMEGGNPFIDNDPASLAFRFIFGISGWFWIIAILGLAAHLTQSRKGNNKRQRSSDKTIDTETPANELPSIGPRHSSRLDRIVRFGGEAQMPIYVLHQTIIVAIGFFVVLWPVIWPLKYLVIVLATLVVTLTIYEFVVKRTAATRFLFGMKPSKKELPAVPAPRPG